MIIIGCGQVADHAFVDVPHSNKTTFQMGNAAIGGILMSRFFEASQPFTGLQSPMRLKQLIVSVYVVPQMQGVGYADVLLYFKCLADAVPCERFRGVSFHSAITR